ncbi:GntR family transcriptional regulator [Gordonia rhizosphera]|uniref:Putative GntR family transcriptional regulator n=1 Tax=Gordonia rhizosphera NBRC 16068 TaxID=1108045 RepID=K6WHL9_9ACTN|nr:GntR family transcriptional regulator [Gordonia rhizosphera]GAB91657.1 putative GntR family transcriptional regulator [Gordonia rhizosphera NBRC 16068]
MAVQERIAGLGPGASLPPERRLAAELGTSRTTLRKALAELTAEGVLSSTQGSGNYVAPSKPVLMRQLTSFSDDLQAMGMTVETTLLSAEQAAADAETAAHLGIDVGASVHVLTRLRIVGGEPLALETAHLPGDLPGLAARVDESGSLYATLREDFGITITDVEDCVQTALASPEHATHLQVPTSAPLLLIDRVSRDSDGRIVEWTRSYYRGDRVRFVARGRL